MSSTLLADPVSIQTDNRFLNDTRYDKLDAGLSLNIDYRARNFTMNLRAPVTFYYRVLDQKKQTFNKHRSDLFVEPSLDLHYDLSSSMRLSASSGLNFNIPGLSVLYGGYLLTDYRNLSAYEANLSEGMMQINSLKFDYKDILNMFFCGLSASYYRIYPKILYGRSFEGILSKTITEEVSGSGDNLSVGFNVSKGFDWKRMKVELNGNLRQGKNLLLIQNEVMRFKNEGVSLGGNLSFEPFRFMAFGYSGAWGESRSRSVDNKKFDPVRTYSDQATFDFALPAKIGLKASLNDYYNNQAVGDRFFSLADLELNYTFDSSTRFALSCTNILNTKSYTYSNLGNLSSFYSEYLIRPRALMLKVRFKVK
jgi:hypothetical protein